MFQNGRERFTVADIARRGGGCLSQAGDRVGDAPEVAQRYPEDGFGLRISRIVDHRLGGVARRVFDVTHPLADVGAAFAQPGMAWVGFDAAVEFGDGLIQCTAADGHAGGGQA